MTFLNTLSGRLSPSISNSPERTSVSPKLKPTLPPKAFCFEPDPQLIPKNAWPPRLVLNAPLITVGVVCDCAIGSVVNGFTHVPAISANEHGTRPISSHSERSSPDTCHGS